MFASSDTDEPTGQRRRSPQAIMPAKKTRVLLRLILSCLLLTLCSGQSHNCSATQYGDQTIYTISGLPHVSSADKSCEYYWNIEGHVLANHKEENRTMVVEKSINRLVTSRCFPKIVFTRGCTSEREGYVVNCTVPCHDALAQDVKEVSRSRLGAGIAGVVFSLTVLVLVFVSCSRYGQLRCGKKLNAPNPDVEEETG